MEQLEQRDSARCSAREIMRATGGNPPPVLDPFCGGGSIPLEAQRLGLEAACKRPQPGRDPDHEGADRDSRRSSRGGHPRTQTRARSSRTVRRGRAYRASPRTSATTASGCAMSIRKGRTPLPGGEAARRWRGDCHRLALGADCGLPQPGLRRAMPLVRSFALSTKKGERATSSQWLARTAVGSSSWSAEVLAPLASARSVAVPVRCA